MRFFIFDYIIAGYVLGSSLALLFNFNIFLAGGCATASLLSVGYFRYFKLHQNKIKTTYALLFLIVIFLSTFFLGIVRTNIFYSDRGEPRLSFVVGQSISGEGVIVSEPDEREKGVRFTIKLISINTTHGVEKIIPTKIIATDGLYSHLFYGDKIKISGTVTLPESFEGDNGKTFNYPQYLAKDKIFYIIDQPNFSFISHHNGHVVIEWLLRLKQKYNKNLDAVISFPESRLGAGLTIAGKKALPPSVLEEFKITGTMQIIVLSGYNITIVAQTAIALLSFLPLTYSSIVAVIMLSLFTIMAGATATMVRACVMAFVALLAQVLHRTYNVTRSLLFAGFIMLLLNPMLLLYDPSFQLSFLATYGLLVVSPLIAPYLVWVPKRLELRNVTQATFAAQIFVSPYLLYQTGQLSWVAFPTNLLLTLFIPVTMLLSFLAGMLTFVSHLLASPCALVAFVLLRYELTVVHYFSTIPGALLSVFSFPLWLTVMWYGCYGVIIIILSKKQKHRASGVSQ